MTAFDGQAMNLEEGPGLLQSAWRYKRLVAIAALVGALFGYAWEARQPTLYVGVSRLLLSADGNRLPGDVPQFREDSERFLSNQVELIGSWPVLEAAAKASPGTSPAILGQHMTTEISKEADVVVIRVLAPTAEEAATLAGAVGTAYDRFVKQSSRDAARAEVKNLDAASRSLSDLLIKLDAEIQASPGDPSLQSKKRAVEEQLDATAKRSQQLTTQARIGISHVVHKQDGAPSLLPAQPKPSRGAATGLLLGLVGSAAFAWFLNSRSAAQPGRSEWDRTTASVGGRLVEPEPALEGTTGGRTDAMRVTGNGNGTRRGGGATLLARWLSGKRPADPHDVEGNEEAFRRRQREAASSASHRLQGTVHGPVDLAENDLRELFARIGTTVVDEPIGWYLDQLPQRMAEQLTVHVYADVVALLLDRAEGPFEVAGAIGLTEEEQGTVVDVDDGDDGILHEALRQGVSVFQDSNPVPKGVSLPGSRNAEALVVAPLVEGLSWLGMLLVARRSADGDHVAAFVDQEIERIILYAMEIAPTLQALLLLHRLQRPLRSLEAFPSPDPGERANRTADSG